MLTNEQRKYLGLNPIEDHWEAMEIKGILYYFDGDIIKKEIATAGYMEDTFYYSECELNIQTVENRSIVLPKTVKGKPKKLNFTATQSFRPTGMYFMYNGSRITIASHTTQKNYYFETLNVDNATIALERWLEKWIKETTKNDLEELNAFKNEKRIHQRYKEGDIFAFKIGRRKYGFGKILIDIVKRRKTEEFKKNKNYGLDQLMGTALIVKVYHKISDNINVDIDKLEMGLSLPAQAIMDNHIYYGEYKIIDNREVSYQDLDCVPISTSKSINGLDKNIAYLQYGLIYMEMSLLEYGMYENKSWYYKDYRDESIGFSLDYNELEDCIKVNSNEPYYCIHKRGKLNNPYNKKDKKDIFEAFGLDGDLNYEDNFKLYRKYLEDIENFD